MSRLQPAAGIYISGTEQDKTKLIYGLVDRQARLISDITHY